MRNPIHLLAQQLTGKPALEECSLDEVKRIAQRYPYFAPAQFLLLQKLRQSAPADEADAQYKKAVLFYPDPPAFEWFIASGRFYSDDADEPFLSAHDDNGQKQQRIGEEAVEITVTEEENGASLQPEPGETSSAPVASPAYDNNTNEEEPAELFTETGSDLSPAVPENDALEELAEQESSAALPVGQKPQTILPAVKDEGIKEEPAHEAAAFEPYHTVDYFASQGIKISPDELPKDKLGKQLKSFTEWLKTMKRLPASQTADAAEHTAEKGVEKLADRSLSDSEVLTEAMAEVWAKQGATQKALDIYNKLSLHNPSKRDYFAAKIENLKHA